MTVPRILIVDDEASIRFVLQRTLRGEGYFIEEAIHGADALEKLAHNTYDLILLDLYMEPIDGLQVLNSVRQKDEDTSIIILTAQGSLESAIEALRHGAFDYLFKPAEPEEIRSRVRAGIEHRRINQQRQHLQNQIGALRHLLNELDNPQQLTSPSRTDDRFFHLGKLVIDRQQRIATLGNKLLDLTTAEFNLLLCLAENTPNPTLPRDLLNCALGYDSEELEAKETIKWHIYNLRRKVEENPSRPRYIKTVRYKGYFWSSD